MQGKKVINNTLMLYVRQILLIIVNLYSLRVVLNVLGVDDFGIYSVVAGIVTLCMFLTGSMTSATQRYFAYALGKKDKTLLYSTFSMNMLIYIVISLVVLLLLQGPGLLYVKEYLVIPEERYESALVLYQYSAFSFLFNITVAPFVAIIIAHEDMRIYAIASIFEALMKLAFVSILVYLPGDKLEWYGGVLLIASVLNAGLYFVLCLYRYNECQIRKIYWDKKLLTEITSFTGWTLFGQLSTVARNQAITVLLNQFFNPAIVASRAISMTVATQVNIFSNNFNTGLYPPIIKSYANGDKSDFYSLIYIGSKVSFYLMWIVTLPFLLEIENVLTLWLGNLPSHTIIFTKLAVVEALLVSISLPIATAARAPGKMKTYELTLGCMQFLILAISYVFLKMDYPAESVFIISILVNLAMFVVRLILVRKLVGLNLLSYFKKVLIPVLFVVAISIFVVNLLVLYTPNGYVGSIINVGICFISSISIIYLFGIEKHWQDKIKEIIRSKIIKFGVNF